ncbi:DMT family transporter [Granulicella sibirica]|uniref:Permease of the drug/metabolite transporter (DMT) superfamily n=1 Tax=Granulicella sibirica TaxID=2479048 RepID=A0A4Q0SV38_9BACT|nr:DMT family transporter [Granulicella sibirica]RXH54915.1 Permease of the drug/metabolite transporter (DMT) superfamily [Granulicella sibirica]
MTTRSVLQILLLSAVWGVSFLLIRISGEAFPPLWIAMMRGSLGALLLWSALFLTGHKPPARKHLPWLLLVALFNNAIPFTCFAWGEQVVPSNTASVLNATTPIWTLLLTLAVYRTRIGWNVIGGVILGFAGVVLVVLNQSATMPVSVTHAQFLRGILLISTGALGYAIAAVIAKAKLQGVDPIGIAACQLGFAALMVAPLALTLGHPTNLHLANWLAIIVLGFAGSGLAYLLFFHLLTTISATHVVAVTYLLPIWGVFWGFIAHEHVGPGTFLGVGITIVGLGLMNLRRGPAAAPATASRPQAEEARS